MDLVYMQNPEGPDEIIDEASGSNSFIALREIKWKDESPFRLDLRKYFLKPDGTEIPSKGISFMTPEGPNKLVNTLLSLGYGDSEGFIRDLHEKNHDDWVDCVARSIQFLQDKEVDNELKAVKDKVKELKSNQTQNATDLLDNLLT